MGGKAKIREVLYNHYSFSDCVLSNVIWRSQGTVLDFVINYIHQDCEGFYLNPSGRPGIKEQRLRDNLGEPLLKTLRLHSVQELHVYNRLNKLMTNHPKEIDWEGFGEIGAIDIEDDDLFLVNYSHIPVPFHHIVVRFGFGGDRRRFDVVFRRLEII